MLFIKKSIQKILQLIQKNNKIIRDQIKFKNILISDDLSMKSLKYSIQQNTINVFEAVVIWLTLQWKP